MLKELFLNYVERQKDAEAIKQMRGAHDPVTVDAFQEANDIKRRLLNAIEEVEKK